ncbi:unnamed protein product [Auanema sp. JU1783]|nr:unnamed protein product [Auanema sp. JU1783]
MSDESKESEADDQLNRSTRSVRQPSPETLAEISVLNASINEAEEFELTFEIVDNSKKKDDDDDEDDDVNDVNDVNKNAKNEAVVDVYGFEVEAEEDEDVDKENPKKEEVSAKQLPQTPLTKRNAESKILSEQRKRKIFLTSTPKTKRVHK